MVFADLFAGTGVVSGSFKKQGYKRLNKKQLKEAISSKNLEEIKENSSERKKFKRVSLGGSAACQIELFVFKKYFIAVLRLI